MPSHTDMAGQVLRQTRRRQYTKPTGHQAKQYLLMIDSLFYWILLDRIPIDCVFLGLWYFLESIVVNTHYSCAVAFAFFM